MHTEYSDSIKFREKSKARSEIKTNKKMKNHFHILCTYKMYLI